MPFSFRPFRRFQLQSAPHGSLDNQTPDKFVGKRQGEQTVEGVRCSS